VTIQRLVSMPRHGHAAEARAAPDEINMRPTPPRAHASAPESSGSDIRSASVEAQLRVVALALRKEMAPPARPHHEERPGHQGRHCFYCGSVQHIARVCPKKFSSHSELPSHHLGGGCLSDSGSSHHMSPGGGAGTLSFTNYRPFQKPLLVHFGKRGAVAPALAMDSLVICGCSGLEGLE
jgi:hypothetical protein